MCYKLWKNFFKAHRAALDKAQDQDEISKLSRLLAMIDDFLNKEILPARRFHSAKVDFELFCDSTNEIYFSFLHKGVHIEEVQALSSIVVLFLDYVELIWNERTFKHSHSNVAKAKADYVS